MKRSEILTVIGALCAIAWQAGCASTPPLLPACSAVNSPNSICGLMNPEDLAQLPGREWVVVSQMASIDREAEIGAPPRRPGNLLAVRVRDATRHALYPAPVGWALHGATQAPTDGWGEPACPGAPEETEFQPHGIDVGQHPSGAALLAVVNHGDREAVELFEIEAGSRPEIAWRGCVPMPPDVTANDVALFEDGSFVVTKFMPPIEGMGPAAIWTLLKIAWGWDTGAVYRWTPGRGIAEIAGSEGSAPNGVAIARDQRAIFVAQWGESNVYRVSLDASDSTPRKQAELDHHPDNLTWTDDGRLLAAGQDGALTEILACGEIDSGGCGLDYGVYAIDPETLAVEQLFTGRGAASVALEVGDDILVGSFSGDQIERISRPR